ncbi:MAG: hypothetical protein AMXMBFR64_44040 [Myxococcales bacterium]
MSIRFVECPAADLAFYVLARLDLGADAASVWDPFLPAAPRALLDAYAAAPGRLWLHWAPLWLADDERDVGALVSLLARTPALGDPAGRTLGALFVEAARESSAAHAARGGARWSGASLSAPIERVRAALWAPGRPPPLRVLHAPSLRGHGRAATVRGQRVVATSLAEPPDQVICQILHEETHPVTDPAVRLDGPRDTRAGQPGHGEHLRLERAAVERTGEALAQAAPELLPAYAAWRRRFGMEP